MFRQSYKKFWFENYMLYGMLTYGLPHLNSSKCRWPHFNCLFMLITVLVLNFTPCSGLLLWLMVNNFIENMSKVLIKKLIKRQQCKYENQISLSPLHVCHALYHLSQQNHSKLSKLCNIILNYLVTCGCFRSHQNNTLCKLIKNKLAGARLL